MGALNLTGPYKRFFKSVLITTVVFFITVLGLHIWFVNNARSVLKQIVVVKSHGKINQASSYHVKFRKLTLRVTSFWALLFQKQLLLDSIKLHDPEIEVFQWHKDTMSRFTKDELSISQEMGKLYNSMLDVLEGFGIERIIINNAKLSLVNKMKPGASPIT